MYGNDLSSRRRTLKGGRCRLTRFCSRWSASTSVPVTIVSIVATRPAICRMPTRVSLEPAWKYDRTRGRSDFALPTYSTSPRVSRKRYTPGLVGTRFSWLSIVSVAKAEASVPSGYPAGVRGLVLVLLVFFAWTAPAFAGGPYMLVG